MFNGPNHYTILRKMDAAESLARAKLSARFRGSGYGFFGQHHSGIRVFQRQPQNTSRGGSSQVEKSQHSEKIPRADFEKNCIFWKIRESLAHLKVWPGQTFGKTLQITEIIIGATPKSTLA